MNPSKDGNIPCPINLQTYYKCRRQDRESAVSGSLRESFQSAEVNSPTQGKSDGQQNYLESMKTPGRKEQGKEGIYQDSVEDNLKAFVLDEEMNIKYQEQNLDKMLAVVPDIMQTGCEDDIQTRARYKTCANARDKELLPPAREKRNTAAVQSMMDKEEDRNYFDLEMKKQQNGGEDNIRNKKKSRRTRSEIHITIRDQRINKLSNPTIDMKRCNYSIKRAESADSFITKELLSIKEQVKISYWGVIFEGKLAAARRGFSSVAVSSNAQMDMMVKFKDHFSPIFTPDLDLKSNCKSEIYRLFLHRESLKRISGDYLKHDANRVQFKECCLSGKCGGVHVNPFKCMSDQQFLYRGFQAEEIYAKMLISSHDLLINSHQLLSQFIQFTLVHENYTFNRLYKALEFLLCWIKYRPRTFQTNPAMLGRIQAFIELLSLKYSPRNNQLIPYNICVFPGMVANTRNPSLLCSCKEFLFGEKELQSRSRVNSKPSSFLDASQDSTAVQGSQINHSQKKRGPPAAAVRAPVPTHLAKKLLSNIEIVKSSSDSKNSGKELKSPQLEKQPVLIRQSQSQQSPTALRIPSQQSYSDTKVEDTQRNNGNADCSSGNIDRISIDFNLNNIPISSSSSSSSSGYSHNHHLSMFAGNSHFSNQLSTRDSLRNIIPSGSQSISTKQIPISKQSTFIIGGSSMSATADTSNFSGGVKSMVSERTNTNTISNGILSTSSSFLQTGGRFDNKISTGKDYPNSRCLTIYAQMSSSSLANDGIKTRRNTDWAPIQEEWQVFEKDESFLEEHEIYELNLEKQARKDVQKQENQNNSKITDHGEQLMTASGLGTSEEKQQSNIQDQLLRNQFIEQQNKLIEHASGEEQEAIRSASYFLRFQNRRVSNNSSIFSMIEQVNQGEQNKDKYQNTENNNNNKNTDSHCHIVQSNQQSQKSFEQVTIDKRIKEEFARRLLLSSKISEIQQILLNLTTSDSNKFCGCLDDCLVEQLKSSWSVEGMLRSEERLNRSLENFKFSRDIFLVVDPAILTQQLCLIDHQLFKDIHIQELFSDKRLKTLGIFKQFAQRNHLNALRERINVFTYYLVLLVLVQNSDRERLNFLQRILEISEYSVKYQNFCVTLSVYFLLNSTNLMLVLPPLLNKLQPHQQQQLKDLENTIQFSKSFGNLKSLMINAQPPMVPALNILTRDMTLVDQQMSDYVILDDAQFLNLDKFELVAQTTNIFYKAQSHDYPFVLRPSLYNFFKHTFKAFMGQYININDSKAIDSQLQALAIQLQSRK